MVSRLRQIAGIIIILALAGIAYARWYSTVVIDTSASDYDLTAQQDGLSVVLVPGRVRSFHLTSNASIHQQHVRHVGSGELPGDALVLGQRVGQLNDCDTCTVAGFLPNLMYWTARPLPIQTHYYTDSFSQPGWCVYHEIDFGVSQPSTAFALLTYPENNNAARGQWGKFGVSVRLVGGSSSYGDSTYYDQTTNIVAQGQLIDSHTVGVYTCAITPTGPVTVGYAVTVVPWAT